MSNSTFEGPVIFTEDDLADPLNWLEHLSEPQLTHWLRSAVWTRMTLPLVVPSTSRFPIEFAGLIKKGSSGLRSRVRAVVPVLLSEWGRDDASPILDDLLVICGFVRCASAVSAITIIMAERLAQTPENVRLRQRCLTVLSGFGCSDISLPTFLDHLNDKRFAAISYRALYRKELRYAGAELERIAALYVAPHERMKVMDTLAADLSSPRKYAEVLKVYFAEMQRPDMALEILHALRDVGILAPDSFIESTPSDQKELYRLLLMRCPDEDLSLLLWELEAVGLELHTQEQPNGEEYIQGAAYRKNQRPIVQDVMATRELGKDKLRALAIASERIASSWAGGSEFEWPM